MRRCYLLDLKEKVDGFIDMLKVTGPPSDQPLNEKMHSFELSYKKIYGIACGEFFSPELRKEAESLGLLVLTPSSEGDRRFNWKFEKRPF
jgi:hypothetical protein